MHLPPFLWSTVNLLPAKCAIQRRLNIFRGRSLPHFFKIHRIEASRLKVAYDVLSHPILTSVGDGGGSSRLPKEAERQGMSPFA